MKLPKWIVVAQTAAMDSQDARNEERWLKLGDDALANRKSPNEQNHYHALEPGLRARKQLDEVARELQSSLRKYLKLIPHN